MHAIVARRDEEPLQLFRLSGDVHVHPVIGQDQHIGIEGEEYYGHRFEQWERQ